MKLLIFLGLLTIFLVSGASAWDMSDPTTSSGPISSGLIGKSVHIVQYDDDSEYHTLAKITGISMGLLETSDIYTSYGRRISLQDSWDHIPGTHWISISSIGTMWEEALPVESEEQEVPSQPGFGSILAILGLVGIAFVLNRQA